MAGGGSIPFEALLMGHKTIATELNPVATLILNCTLDYPARFGLSLVEGLLLWGNLLRQDMVDKLLDFFPSSTVEESILEDLRTHLTKDLEYLLPMFSQEILDGFIYARQVTCPHCGGEAPLLNTFWLSKEEKDQWGVRIVPDGKKRDGTVRFETYRIKNGRGPYGEDPNFATVKEAVGTCMHCKQAIAGEEIKAQARGESPFGKWQDRLYGVVAIRHQPKLDKEGKPLRYQSGEKKGNIKTEKIRFFRPPNAQDLEALEKAEKRLLEKWPVWDAEGLIPLEAIPIGHKTGEPTRYGMPRWCDMFTPRQLLGHLTLIEELNRLKPEILEKLGQERGRAVITYLQFAIDKGLDYNSRQTRWEYTRGIVKGTFSRHDFSLKWTFGEMIFTGPQSGAAWGLSQIVDAYKGIAQLMEPMHKHLNGEAPPLTILHGTAANLSIPERSVDLICMDPPYYNNVQYGELSDYFYVWQKRTLKDLYPELFNRRLTNKTDEAVANPARDGSAGKAKAEYERMMGEIFAECRRALKDDGIMTLMFTHKSQDAWEVLTRSLLEHGWNITASFPVESEGEESLHQKDKASAASSIFLSCRKRVKKPETPATWTSFGGAGVQNRIREAVREALLEFEPLRLNPVDEMVACYGRALRVLSEQWPVLDGDNPVSPMRAMNEASGVVAQYQVTKLTAGRLKIDDLQPEAAIVMTFYGIYGLQWLPFDEALNLSRSLNIRLENKSGGYIVDGRMFGINQETRSLRNARVSSDDLGYHAPVVSKGAKLRLALPEERNPRRIQNPQTEWDILHGLILAYREGDIPVARAYLIQHAKGREGVIKDLLAVWTTEMADKKLHLEGENIIYGLK